MISSFSIVTPTLATAAFNLSKSPPGSTSAAFIVLVHHTSEQFCSSGVTGIMPTRSGGSVGVWFCRDIMREYPGASIGGNRLFALDLGC